MMVTDEQRAHQERVKARVAERAKWAEFHRIYERCVAIADVTWNDRLDAAQFAQDTLAQDMRDRRRSVPVLTGGTMQESAEIPVPLFTPRDREQFIKEASVTLFIEACKRNLTALPELKDAPKEQAPGEAASIEAASGVDEVSADAEAGALAEAGPA